MLARLERLHALFPRQLRQVSAWDGYSCIYQRFTARFNDFQRVSSLPNHTQPHPFAPAWEACHRRSLQEASPSGDLRCGAALPRKVRVVFVLLFIVDVNLRLSV